MDMELVEWPAELFDCLQQPRHGGANLLSFVLHNGQSYRYDENYSFFERPYTDITNIKTNGKTREILKKIKRVWAIESRRPEWCDILHASLEVRGVVTYIPPTETESQMVYIF